MLKGQHYVSPYEQGYRGFAREQAALRASGNYERLSLKQSFRSKEIRPAKLKLTNQEQDNNTPLPPFKRINQMHRDFHIFPKLTKNPSQVGSYRSRGLSNVSPEKPAPMAAATPPEDEKAIELIQLNKAEINPFEQENLLKLSDLVIGPELGQGSQGIVQRAYWKKQRKFVAVKTFSTFKQQEQLVKQINVHRILEHTNIVRYLGCQKIVQKDPQTTISQNNSFVSEAICMFIQMMEGGSLCNLYKMFGPLSETAILKYTKQIVEAVEYLHGRDIVHRDLKCSNFLSDGKGTVKLSDFGTAKRQKKQTDVEEEAGGGSTIEGSFYWMPPEIIISKQNYSKANDIWGIGCTIIEMASAKHPWSSCRNLQQFKTLMREQKLPEIPSYLSQDCQDFIRSCLKFSPVDRPTVDKLKQMSFLKK